MKRLLRHPITSIREPFGTAGLIVAMIALVAALGGTAFAAAKLNSTQKKEVEKIAKKFAGKPGAAGANGTNGSPGAAGKDGTNGTNGTNGAPGEAGKPGESVTNKPVATGNAKCEERGGAEFKVGTGTATFACNGKEGSPWTAGGTLPSGKTETGTWGAAWESSATLITPVSFTIPLAAQQCEVEPGVFTEHGICDGSAHVIKEGETAPAGCTGGTVAKPSAEPGNLCVYLSTSDAGVSFFFVQDVGNFTAELHSAGTTGADLLLIVEGS
jgi:hypothetical protein